MASRKRKTESDLPPRGLLDPSKRDGFFEKLAGAYGSARCSLDFESPLQLLVATILSAQCTDERVNKVTATLFKKYGTTKDFGEASPLELEEDIRSTGFFRNKAKAIRSACAMIEKEFGGAVPDNMERLLRLPGVARKTANVVLGNAFGKAEGIVVDTHVARLSRRLGLTAEKRPEKIEKDLMKIVPVDEWISFSHRMIEHGRRICTARDPDCTSCPFSDLCPSASL